jgi:hypothetical protein
MLALVDRSVAVNLSHHMCHRRPGGYFVDSLALLILRRGALGCLLQSVFKGFVLRAAWLGELGLEFFVCF